jgi:hypothetical protein
VELPPAVPLPADARRAPGGSFYSAAAVGGAARRTGVVEMQNVSVGAAGSSELKVVQFSAACQACAGAKHIQTE